MSCGKGEYTMYSVHTLGEYAEKRNKMKRAEKQPSFARGLKIVTRPEQQHPHAKHVQYDPRPGDFGVCVGYTYLPKTRLCIVSQPAGKQRHYPSVNLFHGIAEPRQMAQTQRLTPSLLCHKFTRIGRQHRLWSWNLVNFVVTQHRSPFSCPLHRGPRRSSAIHVLASSSPATRPWPGSLDTCEHASASDPPMQYHLPVQQKDKTTNDRKAQTERKSRRSR
jgi:hypothetical protein